MSNKATIEVMDQFGRWVYAGSTSNRPASIKQALDTAVRSHPIGRKSGRARAIDADTGQLLDIR
jgi:hypothetical protein